jgi:hypothetical protein
LFSIFSITTIEEQIFLKDKDYSSLKRKIYSLLSSLRVIQSKTSSYSLFFICEEHLGQFRLTPTPKFQRRNRTKITTIGGGVKKFPTLLTLAETEAKRVVSTSDGVGAQP